MAEFEEIRKINETRTLTVYYMGSGLALYLSKDLKDLYGIQGGDRVKAKLLEIYRPKKDREN